ncbi:MAG: hypothetical protein WCJ19_05525 [bacterium]
MNLSCNQESVLLVYALLVERHERTKDINDKRLGQRIGDSRKEFEYYSELEKQNYYDIEKLLFSEANEKTGEEDGIFAFLSSILDAPKMRRGERNKMKALLKKAKAASRQHMDKHGPDSDTPFIFAAAAISDIYNPKCINEKGLIYILLKTEWFTRAYNPADRDKLNEIFEDNHFHYTYDEKNAKNSFIPNGLFYAISSAYRDFTFID